LLPGGSLFEVGNQVEAVYLRWLGVAGIELTYGGHVLAIDPYVTRIPMVKLWLGRVRPNVALMAQVLPRCDDVLTTHAHFDHLLDVPALAERTGAMAYGTPNACALLRACGLPAAQTRTLTPGDTLSLGPFQVRVWPGQHTTALAYAPGPLRPNLRPPLRARDYRMDHVLAYEIAVGGLRLLNEPAVEDPARLPQADVLLASPFTAPERVGPLLRHVAPRLVIPIHWDNFFRPLPRQGAPRTFFAPPIWSWPPWRAWPPLRRVDLAALARTVVTAWPAATVLVPEPMKRYDIASWRA
jgi:L-ascorbate metabolism protein UlaG (beta-lactamase superfamily)